MNPSHLLKLALCIAVTSYTTIFCPSEGKAETGDFTAGVMLGGAGDDIARGVSSDTAMNVIVGGSFTQSMTLGTSTTFTSKKLTTQDAYLAKYTKTGDLLWARAFGGSGDDAIYDVVTDTDGASYVTGALSTASDEFLTLCGRSTVHSIGGQDVFVAKFGRLGGCEWLKMGGGTGNDFGNEVAISNNGLVGIAANTTGNQRYPGFRVQGGGGADVTFLVFSKGGTFQWGASIGGTGEAQGRGITFDASNNVLVTGQFTGQAIISGTGSSPSVTLNSAGNRDIYLAKFSPTGTLLWAKRFGSAGLDYARGIGADGDDFYVSGVHAGNLPLSNTLTLTNTSGTTDLFVSRFNSDGTPYWAKSFPGPGDEEGSELEVDNGGNVYFAGAYERSITMQGLPASGGLKDLVIAKLDPDGTLLWAKAAGGRSSQANYAITVNPVTGESATTGLTGGSITYQVDGVNQTISARGGQDGYLLIAK